MNAKFNIVVTGGAGFIGSNLCEILLEKGYKVVCLDNFSTGKYQNIEAFVSHKNFTLLEGDIRHFKDCQQAVTRADYVLHQAALGSVPRSIEDPLTTNEVNISGFLNMLKASQEAGVKRFIYAASSSTYGDSKNLPKREEIIGKPLSPYAVTKYVNELYAEVFAQLYSLEFIGLRYFNVFGKNQDPNGAYAAVIPKFVKQLIQHQSPVIHGDGSYSRDFTYIENVILMNLLALETTNKQALNQVYNVACGQQTTLNQLAQYLKDLLSEYDPKIKDIPFAYGPSRNGDIPHSLASIEKAQKWLGYQPTHSVVEGLKKAVDWYWKNL
jgi:UDP-N-acetylglucosamine 4-epimerase